MRKVISIDLGGTNIRAAIISDRYEILDVIHESTDSSSFDNLYMQITRLIDTLLTHDSDISAICFGVAGRVRLNGYIDELPNLHMANLELVEMIKSKYNKPCYAINDAHAAGLAEANIGLGRKCLRTYFITISTGFGGALFVNKKFVTSSGEIGHTLFKYHDEYYELEKLVSGTGIKNLAKLNGVELASSKDLFIKMSQGDAKMICIYEDWINLLSNALNFINDTFDVDIFTITGGVMKSKDYFLKSLQLRNKHLRIAECECKEDAGLLGGAVYALDQNEI